MSQKTEQRNWSATTLQQRLVIDKDKCDLMSYPDIALLLQLLPLAFRNALSLTPLRVVGRCCLDDGSSGTKV